MPSRSGKPSGSRSGKHSSSKHKHSSSRSKHSGHKRKSHGKHEREAGTSGHRKRKRSRGEEQEREDGQEDKESDKESDKQSEVDSTLRSNSSPKKAVSITSEEPSGDEDEVEKEGGKGVAAEQAQEPERGASSVPDAMVPELKYREGMATSPVDLLLASIDAESGAPASGKTFSFLDDYEEASLKDKLQILLEVLEANSGIPIHEDDVATKKNLVVAATRRMEAYAKRYAQERTGGNTVDPTVTSLVKSLHERVTTTHSD